MDIRLRDAVRVVSCDSDDWDWVLLDRFAFPPDAPWPGEDAIIEEAQRRCPGGWDVVGHPAQVSWEAGDCLIHCIAVSGA